MVHLPGPWTLNNAKLYRDQLRGIVQWVNEQDDTVIVMGNFNTTPWAAHFSDMLQKTGLINSQIGFGIQPTWPASGGFPLGEIPVDHCLHSEQLIAVKRGSGPTNGADHRPMIVDLSWVNPQEKPSQEEQAKEEQAIIDTMKQRREAQKADKPQNNADTQKDSKKKNTSTKESKPTKAK